MHHIQSQEKIESLIKKLNDQFINIKESDSFSSLQIDWMKETLRNLYDELNNVRQQAPSAIRTIADNNEQLQNNVEGREKENLVNAVTKAEEQEPIVIQPVATIQKPEIRIENTAVFEEM